MADSINGVDFVGVHGEIDLPGEVLDPSLTDLYEDGEALAEMGKHTAATQLRAGNGYTDAAAAAAFILTMKSWIGSAVTIVQNGVTYNDRLIIDVRKIPDSELTSPVYSGGGGAHWMEALVVVQWAANPNA